MIGLKVGLAYKDANKISPVEWQLSLVFLVCLSVTLRIVLCDSC